MKHSLFFILILLIIITGCDYATESSVIGTWKQKSYMGIDTPNGSYWSFRDDGKYSCATDKDKLWTTNSNESGTYSISSSGSLTVSGYDFQRNLYMSQGKLYLYVNSLYSLGWGNGIYVFERE